MNEEQLELLKEIALKLGSVTEQLIRLQELAQESVDLLGYINQHTR